MGLTAKSGVSINSWIGGFYEWLPATYGKTPVPAIIFLHGIGEVGNGTTDLPKLLNLALPKLINNGGNPAFNYEAVVIMPQFNRAWPGAMTVNGVVDYVLKNYNVDKNRIYLTGLSMGGGSIVDWGEAGTINNVAAMAPLCPATSFNASFAPNYVKGNMPMWFFHGDSDATVNIGSSTGWVNGLNALGINPSAKLTVMKGFGHACWDEIPNLGPGAYSYNFNIGDGRNLYQWLLSNSRGQVLPAVVTTKYLFQFNNTKVSCLSDGTWKEETI